MKNALAVFMCILISVILCSGAFAERVDLSALSDEELYALLASAQQEVRKRAEEKLPSPSSDFIYGSNGEEVRINDYIGTDECVVIPEEIDGVPVTRIFGEVFMHKPVISVTLPDTITDIGECAFAWSRIDSRYIGDGCILDLPKSLTSVGSQAFSSNGYSGVIINSDVKLDWYAFENLNLLSFLYIRDGVSPSIGMLNFRGCGQLEIAIIPASVTKIGEDVFEGCNKLKIVTPPGSYAESWAKENFFPVDTEHYDEYVAEYEALYPQN